MKIPGTAIQIGEKKIGCGIEIAHVGFGTCGEGIKAHGKGAFAEELRNQGYECQPYTYFNFETGTRKRQLPDMERNAFDATNRFNYCNKTIDSVFGRFLRRRSVAMISSGTGGGSGTIAILSTDMAKSYCHRVLLRIFIDENMFVLPTRAGDRKYLNTLAQFSLLRRALKRNQELKLDLVTAVTLKGKDRYSDFDQIDRAMHDVDVGLTGQGITKVNEVLGNPEFRFKTYSLDVFDAGINPVYLGQRIQQALKGLNNKRFFDHTLFQEGAEEPNPFGAPIVIAYGDPQVVSDVETTVGREYVGQFYKTVFSPRERGEEEAPYSVLEKFPAANPRKVFLIGVYPINEEWVIKKLDKLHEALTETINKCEAGKSSSSLCDSLKSMATQARMPYKTLLSALN